MANINDREKLVNLDESGLISDIEGLTLTNENVIKSDSLETGKNIKQMFYESICENDCLSFIKAKAIDVNVVFSEPFVSMQYLSWTPLHVACKKGKVKLVEGLLALGADQRIQDKKGETALHVACKYGSHGCVELLLNHDMDNLKDMQNKQGLTPLCKALYRLETAFRGDSYYRTIDLLIEAGCDVNLCPAVTNMTPLHLVAERWGSRVVVEKLIAAGADVNKVTVDSSPLMSALCRTRVDSGTVEALIAAGADVNYRNRSGKYVLHVAVAKSEDVCVEYLLSAGADPNLLDSDGCSPLWIAVSENNIKITPMLLKAGGDVNFTSKEYNVSLLCKAAIIGNKKITQLLLNHNAEVDTMTTLGATALHYAIDRGNFDIVTMLLERNCDLTNYSLFSDMFNAQNALQIALKKGDRKVIKLLLKMGFPIHMIGREVLIESVKEDESLLAWMTVFLFEPPSLAQLARVSVREMCGPSLIKVMETLIEDCCIPRALADAILMKDVLADEHVEYGFY